MRYEVQQEIGNDWENVWRDDAGEHNPEGTPVTFDTLEEAVSEIRDHIIDCINAVEGGDMEDSPDPSEFRIVRNDGIAYEYTGIGYRYAALVEPGMEKQVYRFTWRGIEIEAVYKPRYNSVIAHLEIRSVAPARAPLPITSTGYLSHFHQPGTVEAKGGDVVAQVIAWLDDEAFSEEWRARVEASRQGSLF